MGKENNRPVLTVVNRLSVAKAHLNKAMFMVADSSEQEWLSDAISGIDRVLWYEKRK